MESCFGCEPPNLDLLKVVWVKDDLAKSLCAVPLPQDVLLAPAELLKTIQCMCSSDQPFLSLRGCVSGQLLSPYFANVVGLTVAKGGTIPFNNEIFTHICSCHNFFPLSSVQILLLPACCLLCVL